MGKSEGAFKTLQHRAVRALAKALPTFEPPAPRERADQQPARDDPLVSRALPEVAVECTKLERPTATARRRIRSALQRQPALSAR